MAEFLRMLFLTLIYHCLFFVNNIFFLINFCFFSHSCYIRHLNYNFWWAVGIVGPHLGAIIGAISYYYSSKMRQSFIDDENMFQLNQVIQTKSITSNAASPDNIDHHNSSNHHRHQQQQHPHKKK